MLNIFRRLSDKDANIPIFFDNHGNILNHVIPHFRPVEDIEKAKAVVLWQDVAGHTLPFVQKAKEMKIPLIVVQHGRWSFRDYFPPVNYTLKADKFCVWGTRDYLDMIRGGFSEERLVLTGAPIFEGFDRKKTEHEGNNVVFAPLHLDEEVEENMEIIGALLKMEGLNVTSKLLSCHDKKAYGKNIVFSRGGDKDHLPKCMALLKRTDIVVSNEPGTFELLAMYLDIPVIFVKNAKPRTFCGNEDYAKLKPLPLNGVDVIEKVSELESTIHKHLHNPSLMHKERTAELLNSAGYGIQGSAVQRIVNVIKGCIRTKE